VALFGDEAVEEDVLLLLLTASFDFFRNKSSRK
jgi:hypothetical protein